MKQSLITIKNALFGIGDSGWGAANSQHSSDFYSGNDIKNTTISRETALTYSAVFSCVRVLAETLASMPIKLYKSGKDGNRDVVTNHKIYKMLHVAPNIEMTSYQLKEVLMMQLCLSGNAFCMKLKNSVGDVIGLYPIDSDSVVIDRNKNLPATDPNSLIYKIKSEGKEKSYTRDDIFHIAGLSLNGVDGLTPIGYMSQAIQLGMTYEEFGVNFYRNGANPSGILEHPSFPNEEARTAIKEDFGKRWAGLKNAGKPILLYEGMTYKPITVNQTDAQFLESRKFQIEDICRIYRVPLHLVQNLDRATNNNIEHQSLEFIMYTMLPWFSRFEAAFNQQLLSDSEVKQGYYTEFLTDALLRGDISSRYKAYAVARQWGWMSVNDIRKRENMNSIKNGDIYIEPMNMKEAGTVIEPEGGGKNEKQVLDDEQQGKKSKD
jgi:HK97 family phage portal protein